MKKQTALFCLLFLLSIPAVRCLLCVKVLLNAHSKMKQNHYSKFRLVFSFVILLSTLQVVFASKSKSIKPGELWLDNNGKHINAHGGGLMYHKGVYYWFGEHKNEKSNSAYVGVTCYTSKDLVNWTDKGVALSVSKDPNSPIVEGCIIERPKVIYNALTKKFVMYFHLELKGKGYAAAQAGCAVSDNPIGPYQFLHAMRPNAGLWPLNYNPADTTNSSNSNTLYLRLDFSGGQMARDMTLYVDEDKKAYHIFSSEENQTLQIAELTDDYLNYTGKYIRILPGKSNEAPTLFKRKGKYYLITSGCTGWAPNAGRMAVADSIFGQWTELGNPFVGDNADKSFHSQGTYIQKVVGKKDLYIFMADRWMPQHPIDGRYIWLPILFENDIPVLKWMPNWKLSDF